MSNRRIYHLSDDDRRMIRLAIKTQTKTGYAKNAGLSYYGLSQILKKGSCFPKTYKALVKATKPRLLKELRHRVLPKTVEQELVEQGPNLVSTPPTIREMLEDLHLKYQAQLELLGALQRDVADLKRLWS